MQEIMQNPLLQREMQKSQGVHLCSSCTILVTLLTSCLQVAYKIKAKINPGTVNVLGLFLLYQVYCIN